MNTTAETTTSFTSQNNYKYPYEFIIIQVILGIVAFIVLIALIFLIWYRFFKKAPTIEPAINNRNDTTINILEVNDTPINMPQVNRAPNPLYNRMEDNHIYCETTI